MLSESEARNLLHLPPIKSLHVLPYATPTTPLKAQAVQRKGYGSAEDSIWGIYRFFGKFRD
jgi:hypothetical protein